jgi:hypothetical protein
MVNTSSPEKGSHPVRGYLRYRSLPRQFIHHREPNHIADKSERNPQISGQTFVSDRWVPEQCQYYACDDPDGDYAHARHAQPPIR